MAMTDGVAKLVESGTPPNWPGPIELHVYYRVEGQDIHTNKTTLRLGMYLSTPNGWYIGPWTDYYGSYLGTSPQGEGCIPFNGSIPEHTMNTRWLAENLVFEIPHEEDGTKEVEIFWKWGVISGWDGVMWDPSGSFVLELPPIQRGSAIIRAEDVMLEKPCAIRWKPHSDTFRYRLEFSMKQWSHSTELIHPNTTEECVYIDYVIPGEVGSQFPDSRTGEMTVKLYTYSDAEGEVQIGNPSVDSFVVTVPNAPPSLKAVLSPEGQLPEALQGLYIQGKTRLKATMEAEGKYGAGIAGYSMKVDSTTYTGDGEIVSDFLFSHGTLVVHCTVTDTRGFTTNSTNGITVLPYTKPQLQSLDGGEPAAERCGADGLPSDTGTYLRIRVKRVYAKLTDKGQQKNFCSIRYRVKPANSEEYGQWYEILAPDNLDTDQVDTNALGEGLYSEKVTYIVQIQAVDTLEEAAVVAVIIPSEEVFWHRTRNSLALGKYSEHERRFDCAWDAQFRGEVLIGDDAVPLDLYILNLISKGG